jgi:hypothetical protein
MLTAILVVGVVGVAIVRNTWSILLVIPWVLIFWITRARQFFALRQQKLKRLYELKDGTVKVEVDEDAIAFISSFESTRMPWSGVVRIWKTSDMWIFVWNESAFSFLPRAQVPQAAESLIQTQFDGMQR